MNMIAFVANNEILVGESFVINIRRTDTSWVINKATMSNNIPVVLVYNR